MHDNRGRAAISASVQMLTPEPPALVEGLDLRARECPTQEERMREPSRLNVKRGTGGSFGASGFVSSTNRLVAPGTDLAVASNRSVAHAETTAIIIAQHVVGDFNEGRSRLSGPSPSKGVASLC